MSRALLFSHQQTPRLLLPFWRKKGKSDVQTHTQRAEKQQEEVRCSGRCVLVRRLGFFGNGRLNGCARDGRWRGACPLFAASPRLDGGVNQAEAALAGLDADDEQRL